jgi:nucleotide-binding universal stress UspA family protein
MMAAIRTIMLATDLGASSEAATDEAIALARGLGATLLVAKVIDPKQRWGTGYPQRADQLRDRDGARLQAVVTRARELGVQATFLLWQGEVGETVVAAAEAERVDLVVVGTRRFDVLRRLLIGSVSEFVIRHAPCPVLVVPPLRADMAA